MVLEHSHITDIIEMYKSGMSISQVSKRIGINIKTADKYICNAGIKRTMSESCKLAGLARAGKTRPEIRKPIPECVCDMYKSGLSANDISISMHIDKKRICSYLRDRGILMSAYQKRLQKYGQEALNRWAKNASSAAKQSGGRKNPAAWARTRAERLVVTGYGEEELISELRALGLNPIHQLPVGSYNIDIAFDEVNVAIEVHRGSWHGRTDVSSERIKYLLDRRWKLIYIHISRWGAATDWKMIASKLSSFLNLMRVNPSIPGQYGVLSRNGQSCTTIRGYFDGWTRIEGF